MPAIQKFVVTPNLPPALQPLLAISRNIWWSWNVEAITLLRRVDPDLWDQHEGNPVAVSPGAYADIGDVTLHPVDGERLAGEAVSRQSDGSPTRLRGRVTDVEGKPLAGQFVFVYRDEGMIGRPDLLTTTDERGGFVLNLAEGGKYYLGARDRFGGPRSTTSG